MKKRGNRYIHGESGGRNIKPSRVYEAWRNMKKRCYLATNNRYKYYGGRGISVCKRWLDSFQAFAKDMGPRPNGFSIERINNKLGYCPSNCIWADYKSQNKNRRNVLMIRFLGQTKTIEEWSKTTGIHKCIIRDRYRSGWSVGRMLTEKPRHGISALTFKPDWQLNKPTVEDEG